MDSKNLFATLVLLLFVACHGSAQPYDFFWSDVGFGAGAVNDDLSLDLEQGGQYSIYLYVSATNSDFDHICLDIDRVYGAEFAITDVEAFDFEITVGGTTIGNRWDTCSLESVSPELANEWCCISKMFGISSAFSGGGGFVDNGYDSSANAFLFGRLDLQVPDIGCATFETRIGAGGIFNDGVPVNPTFGSIRVTSDLLLGDVNQDGAANLLDVDLFIQILCCGSYSPYVDCNCDGQNNLLDIPPFIEILLGDN